MVMMQGLECSTVLTAHQYERLLGSHAVYATLQHGPKAAVTCLDTVGRIAVSTRDDSTHLVPAGPHVNSLRAHPDGHGVHARRRRRPCRCPHCRSHTTGAVCVKQISYRRPSGGKKVNAETNQEGEGA
jgi:hypothetical protein